MKTDTTSNIIIPANTLPWSHELKTARSLAAVGHKVTFTVATNVRNTKSADILMDGILWEIKSPKSDRLSAIERNLKRASKQSGNIIIDTNRMKKIHDKTIQALLVKKLRQQATIKRIILVNRKHQVIDINKLA